MEKFNFSTSPAASTSPSAVTAPATTFNGTQFYNVYKEAEFLRSSANVEMLLSKGHELRQNLKALEPGKMLKIEGMALERNTPLLVKKTTPNVKVEDYEFTYNRLIGIVAAYAYDHRHRFPVINCSEANALGLTWDNSDDDKCKLYLSAVSGSEHHIDQFSFWPLICALRKLQLEKIPEKIVIKMAKIKNDNGDTMAKVMKNNANTAVRVWKMFPRSSGTDLRAFLAVAPFGLRKLFTDD